MSIRFICDSTCDYTEQQAKEQQEQKEKEEEEKKKEEEKSKRPSTLSQANKGKRS